MIDRRDQHQDIGPRRPRLPYQWELDRARRDRRARRVFTICGAVFVVAVLVNVAVDYFIAVN